MAKSQKSEDVPKAMEEKFNRIVALTDDFSRQYLNDEYAQLIRQATAALCRKRPSPIEKGQPKTWAAGITHAIGMVNFLFDRSQTPHVSPNDLYRGFDVSASTGQAKSKLVRDTLKMMQMDPDWSLPSRIDDNPLVWMLSVNGIIMDIRHAPLGAQVEAFRQGLIPYIPGHKEDSEAIAALLAGQSAPPSSAGGKAKSARKPAPDRDVSPEALQALYVMDIVLIAGPMTEAFQEKNPQVMRRIEIRGDQTLADLHAIIFKAFNREEEHMYEFQLRGAGPNDSEADRYGLIMEAGDEWADELAGDVTQTQIGALGLAVDEPFGYWFDFGDDWWHQVQVVEVATPQPKVKYPRITLRVGASPPQYADF